MKRTALRRTPFRRRPRSPHASVLASYQVVRERSEGLCEGHVAGVCTRFASHVHHRRLRSQGGSNEPENLLHLCASCHSWCHRHPVLAEHLGLLETRGGRDSAKLGEGE